MQDSEVVGGDEEVDGIEVVLGVLGKGISPAYQATGPGPQRAEPTLDVASFAIGLSAGAVGSLRESCRVGIPVVAAGGTVAVARCQRGP